MQRKFFLGMAARFALVLAAMAEALASHAQNWPAKPIRIVVPFASGATDAMTRLVAEKLQVALSQTVIVDNKPGAGGMIGADIVAKAPPDGHTLLMTVDSVITQLPTAMSRMPFKPDTDLLPVSMISTTSTALIVTAAFPAASIQDLMAYAKANPGKLNYGSAVVYNQIKGEELKAIGLSNNYIPYKGGGPMQMAVMSGEVDMAVMDIGSVLAAGSKVRPLMTFSPTRLAKLPNVPTARELGYEKIEGDIWYGMFAPTGTPEAVANRLAAELAKILTMPDVKEKASTLGMEPRSSTPAQLAQIIKQDTARYGKVIQSAGIKLD